MPDAGNTTGLTYLLLILVIAFWYAWLLSPRFKHFLRFVFVKNKWRTSLILLIIAIIWQLQFVYCTHPAIGFDVSAVRNGLLHPESPELRGYFSVNYNNLPLLITLHQVTQLLHATSWLTLGLASDLVTDLSALAIIGTVAVIDKEQLLAAFYVTAIWLALFPICMVPYTDVWAILPVALSIFCWSLVVRGPPAFFKVLGAWLGGASLALAVWLKSSTAVWGIAAVLAGLFYILKTKKELVTCAFGVLFAADFAVCYLPLQETVAHQDLIQVNKKRASQLIHFINVGLTHDGAYDPQAALQMDVLPTKKQKIAYSKKQIKKRMQCRGFWGYLAFLVKKQGLNTADGTFGWLHEGHFIIYKPPTKGWAGLLANFIYPKGRYVIEFRIVAQIFWTWTLLILTFSWQKGGLVYQTLRLAIVGVFLFLLLFEGGRSRYLVQILPAILVLTSLSTTVFADNFHRFKNALTMQKE